MRKSLVIAGLFAALSFTLFQSYELKRPCLEKPWGAPQRLEYRNLCYNDVQALYGVRKLDQRAIPYIEEKSYEYPVLMGMSMWATSLFAHDHVEYFKANVPLLAFMAILSLAGLWGAIGLRRELLWFAIGTPTLFYAFLNWDLIPVACVCIAMWAWSRERIAASGAALGLGVAAKIYPGFLLPSLMIALWRKADHQEQRTKKVARLLAGFSGAWLAANLPVLIAEYAKTGAVDGWLSVFSFHAKRASDFGTVWYWLYRFSTDDFPTYLATLPAIVAGASAAWVAAQKRYGSIRLPLAAALSVLTITLMVFAHMIEGIALGEDFRGIVDHCSEFLFASGTIALLFSQWKRGNDSWATGAGILALYLAVSKIHSPQHALWVLPLMLSVRVPLSTRVGYLLGDAFVFAGGFTWFATSPEMQFNFWQVVFIAGVFVRAGFLLRFSAQCALGAPSLMQGKRTEKFAGEVSTALVHETSAAA
ncbi:MAG: hypothetical protein ACJ763_02530 [Bdellovibrionia bacterium]